MSDLGLEQFDEAFMEGSSFSQETDVILQAVSSFRKELHENARELLLAPYGHVAMKTTIPIRWAAYHDMCREFLQTLANEINAFGIRIAQLEAWGSVLSGYELNEQMVLRIEFVDSISLAAIGAPYALRSRFIYAVTHLCHQANRLVIDDWKESRMPAEKSIGFKEMVATAGEWEHFDSVRILIEKLSYGTLQAETRDFRNSYQHRLPPHLIHGVSQMVSRQVLDGGGVSYGFGGRPAISLLAIVEALEVQHACAMSAFSALSLLALEQLEKIYEHQKVDENF